MNYKILTVSLLATLVLVACKKNQNAILSSNVENIDTLNYTKPEIDTTSTAAMVGGESHNSQNSVDWMGTYEAVVPCADCPGIKTDLTLNKDNTFTISEEYLDKKSKNEDKGSFSWDATGSIISLNGKSTKYQYKVGENTLFMLDTEGKEIQGALQEHYIFKKK
ncbi:copper resistance protein NlpE [Chryseobacterium sp.]|uniref:copper resistance protein NlpE n=1 Tax=Chryseobacterium sp. TaxID=1871047 RepID=UPI003890623E